MAYGLIADGVFNIIQTTRQDFRDFIGGSFNVRKPIFYTVDGTLMEEHGITELELSSFKHKFGYGGNDNTINNSIRSIRLRHQLRTPTTSDNEFYVQAGQGRT